MEEGDGGLTANPVPDAMDTEADVPETDNELDNSVNESTTLVCTASNCNKEADEFMIECNRCKYAIHFACTRLPAYQLSMFMTKGYKRYICESCYGQVDQYYTDNCCDDVEGMAREKQLLTEIERLTTKAQSLEEENSRTENRLKAQGKILVSLRAQVSASPKKANDTLITENKMLVAKIAEMQEEIAAYSQSFRDYETNEATLKSKIRDSETILVEQQKKFDEAGNPDFDNIVKLEELMKKEIIQMGQSIKESLVKEIKDNNKLMEEKLQLNQPLPTTPWIANNDSTNAVETTTQPWNRTPPVVDFRAIMQETQNEQLNEANDLKVRAKNIIIHGVGEDSNAEKTTAKKKDEDFANNLLKAMKIENLTFRSVHRIGKPDPEKKRPMMLMLSSESDKDKILASLTNLRNQVEYKGVSVTEDYTLTERKLLQDWRDKAKAKNNEEDSNSNYIWRVRGTPKNGLELKRFLKQRPVPRVA